MSALLELDGVGVSIGRLALLEGISLTVERGQVLGLVGESGSGKSVTMMSLLRLLPAPPAEIRSGEVLLDGRDLLKISDADLREVRGGKVGFVFQDPMTSLNPVFTVGFQIMEPLRKHLGMTKRQARARAAELLALVGIPAYFACVVAMMVVMFGVMYFMWRDICGEAPAAEAPRDDRIEL